MKDSDAISLSAYTVDHWENLYDDPYAVKRIEKSVKLAKVESGMRVLDVGCNKCEILKYLPTPIAYKGIDGIFGDKIDGGFDLGRKYDRIFCLEVLEHLVNPKGTLEAIKRHLSKDGIAVISLPNEATLFHRLRALFGVVDGECFSNHGKHLHLPSKLQARRFVSGSLDILAEDHYISLCGTSVRPRWVGRLLNLLPHQLVRLLSNVSPSLFSRGFIFVCKLS